MDIVTLVHLTKLYLAGLVERDYGYILLVSSIGAYQPSPTDASYAAAKSFVLNFGEAVNYEPRKTNVRVSVLSPGVTSTGFLSVAGQRPTWYQRRVMMQSPAVARIGIESMIKGKLSTVAGLFNALSTQSARFLSRRVSAALAAFSMRVGG